MRVSVTEAKGQLTELVRRAEAGDDVILTRHGHEAVRVVPVKTVLNREERRTVIQEAREAAKGKILPGPSAARSQDFLYDEFGFPK